MAFDFKSFANVEPVHAYAYRVEIPGLSPLYIQTGTFPFHAFEDEPYSDGNSNSYLPVIVDCAGPTIEVIEDINGTAFSFFHNWYKKIYDLSAGTYNIPLGSTGFKKDISVSCLNYSKEVIWTIGYQGAWPKSISDYSPNHSSVSEHIIFTVTFSIDTPVKK